MSSHRQSYRAGEAEGRTPEMSEEIITKNKAEALKHKTLKTAEQAERNNGGILQQTGEKMRNMALGAADAVKNTFGLADVDEEDQDYVNIYISTIRDANTNQ